MGIVTEFKEFALKGNVLDLAVGVIIGAAFGKIVTSLTNDILMPPLGRLVGKLTFTDYFLTLDGKSYPSLFVAKQAGAPTINYGSFLNNLIDFLLIAFAIFLLVKAANQMRRRMGADPEESTKACPFCVSKIDIKATRCPNCTWTLPPPRSCRSSRRLKSGWRPRPDRTFQNGNEAKMNKWLHFAAATAALSALAALAGAVPASARRAQESGITVTVNGGTVEFPGQGPIRSGGRVLVPLRGVLERMGAYVSFDPTLQTVRAVRNETQINLPINSLTARIGERVVRLDVPARVVNGSTLVPLRFVAEALGASVAYRAATRTVAILSGPNAGGPQIQPPVVQPPVRPGLGQPSYAGPDYRAGQQQGKADRDAGRRANFRRTFPTYVRQAETEFLRGYRNGLAGARRDPAALPRPLPVPSATDSAYSFGYKQAQRDFIGKMPANPQFSLRPYREQIESAYQSGYNAGYRRFTPYNR